MWNDLQVYITITTASKHANKITCKQNIYVRKIKTYHRAMLLEHCSCLFLSTLVEQWVHIRKKIIRNGFLGSHLLFYSPHVVNSVVVPRLCHVVPTLVSHDIWGISHDSHTFYFRVNKTGLSSTTVDMLVFSDLGQKECSVLFDLFSAQPDHLLLLDYLVPYYVQLLVTYHPV